MRRVLIIGFLLMSIAAKAQFSEKTMKSVEEQSVDVQKSMVVKTRPLSYLLGDLPLSAEWNLQVEIPIKKRFSLQLGGGYVTKSPLLYIVEEEEDGSNQPTSYNWLKIRCYLLDSQLRVYLPNLLKRFGYEELMSNTVISGLYTGLNYSYGYAKYSEQQSFNFNNYISINHNKAHVIVGLQNALFRSVVSDIYFGVGYKNNIWKERDYRQRLSEIEDNEMGDFYNNNLSFVFGLAIGFGY